MDPEKVIFHTGERDKNISDAVLRLIQRLLEMIEFE